MPAESLTAWGLWNLASPAIPPRSRLYPLDPIGRGTPDVESLSSYLLRLAQAHGVDPHVLMTHEIQPYIGKRRLIWPWAMNGSRLVARRWVAALDALTRGGGLADLTFLPWARVLDAVPLLRRERAWCPACYQTWRTLGTPVYDPLLWAVRGVTVCRTHRCPLEERCPSPRCRAWSRILGRGARPGHCARCQGWLGHDAPSAPGGTVERPAAPIPADPAFASAVEVLIATSTTAPGSVRLDRRRPLAQPRDWVALVQRWHLGVARARS